MQATIKPSLNEFLNRLPELVVNNMTFLRQVSGEETEYRIGRGIFKFTKLGYKEYAVDVICNPGDDEQEENLTWKTESGAGSIHIDSWSLGLSGMKVFLGEDVSQFNWD